MQEMPVSFPKLSANNLPIFWNNLLVWSSICFCAGDLREPQALLRPSIAVQIERDRATRSIDHTRSEALGKIVKLKTPTAMTNARFAAFHGVSVAPCPLSTKPVSLRKSRARHGWYLEDPQWRRASVWGRRAAFRSGFVPLGASRRLPLHFPPAVP